MELHREIVNVVGGQFSAQVVLPQAPSGAVSIRAYAWNETQDTMGQTTFSISQRLADNVRLEREAHSQHSTAYPQFRRNHRNACANILNQS